MRICLLFILLTTVIHPVHSQKLPESLGGESAVSVVVFLAADCPISQKYIPTLNRIHEKYEAQHVKMYAFIPGSVTKDELSEFETDYDLAFPVSADGKYDCARALQARTTPEVFVFDEARVLRYRGAIDNWFYELGKYRKEPTEHYLIDAIDALLAGRQPGTKKTEPFGCFIQIPGGD